MMKIDANLGNTGEKIIVDLDSTQISFGADSDDVHCWTCVTADLGSGAWIVPANLRDGRAADPERWGYEYAEALPGQEQYTKTLVCCDCAIKHGYGETAKPVETVAQRNQRLAAKHGIN